MARRQRKTTPRRKNPKTINASALAESYLLANVVTQTMFRANPIQFVTGYSDGRFRIGSDGSTTLTIPEMIKGTASTVSSGFTSAGINTIPAIVKYNLDRNNSTQKLVMGLVGIPIAFRVGNKLLRKPRSQTNKLLRMTGLGVRI